MMNVKYPERKSILTRARAPVRPLQPNGLLLLLIAFWGWSKHRYALAFRHAYSIFNSKPATRNNNKTAHSTQTVDGKNHNKKLNMPSNMCTHKKWKTAKTNFVCIASIRFRSIVYPLIFAHFYFVLFIIEWMCFLRPSACVSPKQNISYIFCVCCDTLWLWWWSYTIFNAFQGAWSAI